MKQLCILYFSLLVLIFGQENNTNDIKINLNWTKSYEGIFFPVDIASNVDGDIFVLDRSDQKVKVLSKNGDFNAEFGGKGEGPGEFTGIDKIKLSVNNEIYVYDGIQNRFTTISTKLEFLTLFQLEKRVNQFMIRKNGNLIVEHIERDYSGKQGGDLFTLVSYDKRRENERMLFSQVIKRGKYISEPMRVKIPYAFPPKLHWTLSKEYLLIGLSNELLLNKYDFSGKIIDEIKFNKQSQKITEKEKNKYFERMMMYTEEGGTSDLPDYIKKNTVFPRYLPFYKQMDVYNDNFILLLDYNKNTIDICVYNLSGEFLGQIEIVAKSEIRLCKISNNTLLLVEISEEGITSISKYKLF